MTPRPARLLLELETLDGRSHDLVAGFADHVRYLDLRPVADERRTTG